MLKMSAVIKKPNLIRNVFFLAGVFLLIIAFISHFKNKNISKQEEVKPEEIFISEEGTIKKSSGEEKRLSEEEIKRFKEETDKILTEQGKRAELKDLSGWGAGGEAKSVFLDNKYYLKIKASGLRSPEKGYYYQGWLKKNDDYLSVGRLETNAFGEGFLYYTSSSDKSDRNEVVVTLEPEDGKEEPAKAVLQGEWQ